MSKRMPPYSLRDFSLGLNNKDDAYMIDQRQLSDVQNAIIERGVIHKRHGFKKYTPVAITPITKLYDFHKSNGTKEFLAVSNQTLYKDTSGTLGAISGSLTSSSLQFLGYKDRSIQDVVLIADSGKFKAYNGTSIAEVTAYTPTTPELTDPGLNDLANLTNFRAIVNKKDRIFAAAHSTVKNRLSFCHRDPTLGYAVYDYWPATFFFDVATDENDEIVQLKVFRDSIIIFCKRTSPWVLRGDGRTINDYELHKINTPTGCIAPNSVAEVGNFLFYLSDDHIYSLFSTDQNYISAEPVSMNVEGTLKNISRSDKEKAVGTFYNNKYYLSFPDGTCLIFDTELKSWTEWNLKANSFLNRDGVLFFANDNGLIYEMDETIHSDDSQSSTFSFTTKNTDFGYDVNHKDLRRMWVVAKQYQGQATEFALEMTVDYNTYILNDPTSETPLVWGQGKWGETVWGFVDVVQIEIDFRDFPEVISEGKNFQFTISQTSDKPLTIYGLILEYNLRKAR